MKLRSTSTVKDFQRQFEKLVNRTRGKFFKSYFISELKEEITMEVKMHGPKIMQAALECKRHWS